MLESFSASGFLVHTPCGPRKSGMPESVEMPAPVRTTIRWALATQLLTAASKLRHLDLAAAARAAERRQRPLRHDDLRRRLAAQLLQLLHRALDRLARVLAEFVRGFLERHCRNLEADRQRACGRQHLRLALVDHGTRAVALPAFLHRRKPADGADAPVGEDLLQVKRVRINLDVVGGLGFGSHVSKDAALRAASRRGTPPRRGSTQRAARSSTSKRARPRPAPRRPAGSSTRASTPANSRANNKESARRKKCRRRTPAYGRR